VFCAPAKKKPLDLGFQPSVSPFEKQHIKTDPIVEGSADIIVMDAVVKQGTTIKTLTCLYNLYKKHNVTSDLLSCPTTSLVEVNGYALLELCKLYKQRSPLFSYSQMALSKVWERYLPCVAKTLVMTAKAACSKAGPQPGTGKLGIAPPGNFCKHDGIHVLHAKCYFLRLRYLNVNFFLRQLFRIRFVLRHII